jgi:membrane protein required for colicin V production
MTSVDFVVLGLMVLSGLLAWSRGLVREVLSLLSWVGAVGIAGALNADGKNIVAQWLPDPGIAAIVSFIGLLLVSVIVLKIAARAVSGIVKGSVLGGLDRTLGLVFGLARGAVVAVLAYVLGCLYTPIDHWPDSAKAARSLPLIYAGAKVAREKIIPESYRPRLYAPPAAAAPESDALLRATPVGRPGGQR